MIKKGKFDHLAILVPRICGVFAGMRCILFWAIVLGGFRFLPSSRARTSIPLCHRNMDGICFLFRPSTLTLYNFKIAGITHNINIYKKAPIRPVRNRHPLFWLSGATTWAVSIVCEHLGFLLQLLFPQP